MLLKRSALDRFTVRSIGTTPGRAVTWNRSLTSRAEYCCTCDVTGSGLQVLCIVCDGIFPLFSFTALESVSTRNFPGVWIISNQTRIRPPRILTVVTASLHMHLVCQSFMSAVVISNQWCGSRARKIAFRQWRMSHLRHCRRLCLLISGSGISNAIAYTE